MNDSWLVALLLIGLPEHYEPMIMGLETSGANLTSDAVKAKILQDVKLERGPLNSNDDGALYTKNRNKFKLHAKKKPDKTCFNSGKPGHFASKCLEYNGIQLWF